MDANASLSSSTHVATLNTAASAMTDPAALSRSVPTVLTASPGATAGTGGGTTTIVIEKLEIPVQALADPTNPIEWKKMIDAIHEGIRMKENEQK